MSFRLWLWVAENTERQSSGVGRAAVLLGFMDLCDLNGPRGSLVEEALEACAITPVMKY